MCDVAFDGDEDGGVGLSQPGPTEPGPGLAPEAGAGAGS